MEIKRDFYLQELIDRMGNGMIKVVTGIRRCGKSYLLFKIFFNYLKSTGVADDHIICLQLDDRANKEYLDPDNLYNFVKSRIVDERKYYVLLDEVQFVNEFESVLNSFLHIDNVDVYVTGSNAKFLSKDIITEFRGRGDEVRVHPLSFSEFYSVFDGDKFDAWNEYYTYGGLPAIVERKTEKQKADYLINVFKEAYIKDIVERNGIKNDGELEELLNILSSSIGSLTNPSKLKNTFKSVKGAEISEPTIKTYLTYLEDSFIVNKALRFDVKGKKYINTPSKYYFEDVGLRNARLNFRQQEENHIMENIIYNELRIRGFNVDVGIVEVNEKQDDDTYCKKTLEVDFIANQGSKKYYIQSAFRMIDDDKINQEKKSLQNVNDFFKKIVVVKDRTMLSRDEKGIVTMDIFDFLLLPNSLEL